MSPAQSSRRHISQITRETTAIVLAAGHGSHLRPLTACRTKAALPFGGRFRLIDFTLNNCLNSGITMIGVGSQYKSRQLSFHLQKSWAHLQGQFGYFVSLLPAEQGHSGTSGWYRGTADTLYHNLAFIRDSGCEYVLILYGDHVYQMDYGPLMAHHIATGADITLGMVPLTSQPSQRYGVLATDPEQGVHRITAVFDDTAQSGGRPASHASMGVFALRRELLERLLSEDQAQPGSEHSFRSSIVRAAIRPGSGLKVMGYPFGSQQPEQQSWRPIHTIDQYYAANMDLVSISPRLNLYNDHWPLWAHQPPAPGAKLIFDDDYHGHAGAINTILSDGVLLSGARCNRSLLFTGARAGQRSQISDSLLLPGARIGRDCHIRRAIIGEDCCLPDNTCIGIDPQADSKRFHVTPSRLVVITRRMLDAQ